MSPTNPPEAKGLPSTEGPDAKIERWLKRLHERRAGTTAGLSDVLYHVTNNASAVNILEKDRFELKPSEGTSAEERIKAAYYLSCARSRQSDYFKHGINNSSVILTLDGRALGSRYAGQPVNYWEDPYHKSHGNNEMEDRVFSKEPFITKATSYITGIDVAVNMDEVSPYVFALYRLAKLRHIPVRFFLGQGVFDKANVTRLCLGQNPDADFTPSRVPKPGMSEYWQQRQATMNHKSGWLWRWAALYKIPDDWDKEKYATWLKTVPDVQRTYSQLFYGDEAVRQFSTYLHNAKSEKYGDAKKERENLDYLIKVMRSHKWNVKDFVEHLYNKFVKDKS